MTKTRMTQEKRKQLYAYLQTFITKYDKSLDVVEFRDKINKFIADKLDDVIISVYGDRIKFENDWLKSVGVRDTLYCYVADKNNKVTDQPFNFDFGDSHTSTLVIGNNWDQINVMCDGKMCEKSLRSHAEHTINTLYQDQLQKMFDDFRSKFYKATSPFIKLIQQAKCCEDIYKTWEDEQVYKILFPQKTYAVSSMSQAEYDFITTINKMVKKNENEKANKRT